MSEDYKGSYQDDPQVKYQKLREYLRLYKKRLYLVPRHQIFEDDKDMRGFDYHTYKDLQEKNTNIIEVAIDQQQETIDLLEQIGVKNPLEQTRKSRQNKLQGLRSGP